MEVAGGDFRAVDNARRRFWLGVLSSATATTAARLDKWLWAVRIFKTRSRATDACRAGSVSVNQLPAKPGRDVHAGETVPVQQGVVQRTLRVLDVPRSRIGAPLVAQFCTDLTPPEEFEKARIDRIGQALAREKGSGRPTKRDRRLLDQLFD